MQGNIARFSLPLTRRTAAVNNALTLIARMTEQAQDTTNSIQDPGLMALVLIGRFHGIAADAEQLRHAAAIKSTLFRQYDFP
jgi:hypothetical protein